MSKSAKAKTITFYVIHLPVFIILVAIVIGASAGAISTEGVLDDNSELAQVLGKGSDNGDGDNEDDNDDAGEDDDDKEYEDRDEDDDSERSGSNSGSGSNNSGQGDSLVDDLDGEDEINDVDNEGNEDEDESREIVVNEDGSFVEIRREEKEGELKYEVRTYDAAGNKIQVQEYELDEDGEEKSRFKVYDEFGNKIKDLRFETEDGKEIELRIKEGETELSRVEFDIENQELLVRTGEDDTLQNKLRIRAEGDQFVLTRAGQGVLSNFPLAINDETGEVFVQTPKGEVILGAMPDSIIEKIQLSDDFDIDAVETVVLDASADVAASSNEPTSDLEYIVTGTKAENLFGIFNLSIPSEIIFDAQTGDFLRTERSFVTRVLDLFSF